MIDGKPIDSKWNIYIKYTSLNLLKVSKFLFVSKIKHISLCIRKLDTKIGKIVDFPMKFYDLVKMSDTADNKMHQDIFFVTEDNSIEG